MLTYIKKGLVKLGILLQSFDVIVLGLDNSGKTTLIHLLQDNLVSVNLAYNYQRCCKITVSNTNLHLYDYDLGGRPYYTWQKQYQPLNIQAIIFLIDTKDCERLDEAKQELTKVLNDPKYSQIPVLILGNKIDKQGALVLSLDMLLSDTQIFQNRQIKYFPCSMLKRIGYQEGFQWLVQQLK